MTRRLSASRSGWAQKLVFAVAGTVGFLVDAGLMQLLSAELGVQVHLARVASFLLSMTVTWQVNRRFTFRAARRSESWTAEWRRYFASSLLGGATNFAVFSIAIAMSAYLRTHLVLPVAAGCLAGMVTNYLLYSRYVFQPSDSSIDERS